MSDWNGPIIEEFRANKGKVGGMFEGAPIVILHTKGARSGVERINPLMAQPDGDKLVIFASKAGAPSHPDWYRNVVANPDVTVEFGTDTKAMRAHIAEGEEREKYWSKQKTEWPQFAGYEEQTKGKREIPVIVLEPVS